MCEHADDSPGSDAAPLSGLPGAMGQEYIYEILGHRRRRMVCHAFAARDEWSVTDLAARIAAWESATAESASEAVVEQVELSLHHAHLPKLAEHDVVAFDGESGTLRPADNTAEMQALLRGIEAALNS